MSYQRVLPRDLFNESKLLKCVGKIAMLVEDEMIAGLRMDASECADGFNIEQDIDGNIYIANLSFYDQDNNVVHFLTSLNSKYNWPLLMVYKDNEYYPFNEDGGYQLADNLFSGANNED